jgi:DNA-binding NtrC family response regulator
MARSILIVDDDPTQRRLLETVIRREGYLTRSAENGEAALAHLESDQGQAIDLVILDLMMPGLDGYGVLSRLHPKRLSLPVIVLTAQGGIETVVNAMRAGASDFVVKPVSPERLIVSIKNALKVNALADEVCRLKGRSQGTLTFDDLIGTSAGMLQVVRLGKRAAASAIPILLEGESGVGKEMIARAIQGSSDRAGKPFVAVNCGAIPQNLMESILFGHEKGAFTGAVERHRGKFQEAHGGTLFLDEIGELPLDMQVKLLRALQEGEVDPVGARQPVKVDIRLISATNRDLAHQVENGAFREDLFYRLNVFPIHIPPLRERPEDIAPLAEAFVTRIAAEESKKVEGISPEALSLLESQPWPGNVRQLENTVFRAVVLADTPLLQPNDFPQLNGIKTKTDSVEEPASAGCGVTAAPVEICEPGGHLRTLGAVEADMIRFAIDRYSGHMSEVARRLGIGRSTLYRKLRDLGMEIGSAAE